MADKRRSTPIDWEDVRFFAALARRRTLTAAARVLGVPRAIVVRRLASLEAAMGGPLFTRHRQRLVLNALGVAALIQAEQMAFAASALSVLAQTVTDVPRGGPTGARVHGRGSSAAVIQVRSAAA